MTNADLTEMEWLAATLMHTASRLQRAVALLRAAGDLEKLQARLAAIAAPAAVPAGERILAGVAVRGDAGVHESPRETQFCVGVRASALPVLSPASSTAADRPAEAGQRRELGSLDVRVGASRAAAVFDGNTQSRLKRVEKSAVAPRAPF